MQSITYRHRDWGNVTVEKIGAGIERQMVVGDQLMICRLRFAPHTVTEPHHHPHEQMTLVERGWVRAAAGRHAAGSPA